jgi:hypothetical protein
MELRVAIDAMGAEPREVAPGEVAWVLDDAYAWSHPYVMDWIQNVPRLPPSPLDYLEPWDPWRRLDEWSGQQEQAPRSVSRSSRIVLRGPGGETITMTLPYHGEELRGGGGGRLVLHTQAANTERWLRVDPAADTFTEITWNGPPEGQAKVRFDRAHLQRARPPRRLDGRRA